MTSNFRIILLALPLLSVLALACGKTEVGDACDDEGKTDECVDNAVCAKDKAGATKCLKVCTEQAQCAATEECNGTTGSLKACRAK